MITLTKKLLDEMFHYDPLTGILIWKHRPRCHFNSESGYKIFNAKYPGKNVGHISNYSDGEYRLVGINGRLYKAHRLIYFIMKGYWPDIIDHINGVRTDNRWINLREVDALGNSKNAKRRVDNKSGVTGVHWFNRTKTWMCYIDHKGSRIHLGYFKNKKDAIDVRKNAEITFNYHKNHDRG